MNLRLLNAAEGEMLKAARWYDGQQAGLGDDFLDETAEALKAIEDSPSRYWIVEVPRANREIRCCLLQRFPYAIYFEIRLDEVLVLAVAHTARRPFYWRRRK